MNTVLRLIKAGLIWTGKPVYILGKILIQSGIYGVKSLASGSKTVYKKLTYWESIIRKSLSGLKDQLEASFRKKRRNYRTIFEKLKEQRFFNFHLPKKIEKKAGIKKKANYLYLWLTLGCALLTWGVYWFYGEFIKDLPSINRIDNPPELSTKIVDRKDRLLYKFYDTENRSWVELKQVPQSLIWATIAIEDKNFYKHHGISLEDVVKATIYNFKNAAEFKIRGGSTITQQLVKKVFLTSERTWKRKVKEAILALMVERRLGKNEILERYFNQVPYGGETYGVQEAAWKYFGKNVWEVNMAEAAFLAGLPAAPSSYSPFGVHPELAKIRQEQVIDQMVVAGYINKDKGEALKKESISLVEDKRRIDSPHFVFYVKEYLINQLGFENIESQGLYVKTTLDLDVQREAERIVGEEVDKVERLNISNGAMIVMDPKSGGILAMVGSKDYYATDIDGKYNVTTALRQPGSSIKPINYLLALSRGKTLSSPIDDSPISYYVKGQKPYTPQNYNGKYMGRVTLKTALASSLNIPSVKLLNENGVQNMIDLGEEMGITTWEEKNRFGLSLALGSGEVKMTELAGAYSIFANLGEKREIGPVMQIKNYLGEKIYENDSQATEVVDPGLAFLINQALSDNRARTPIFGPYSKLVIPGKTVAVKTGTTNSMRDNWCIGWTPSYLVAAWVGNNNNSPMNWVASGVSGATPIWNRMMSQLLKEKQDEIWPEPEDVIKVRQCGREEYYINGTELNRYCEIRGTPTPTN